MKIRILTVCLAAGLVACGSGEPDLEFSEEEIEHIIAYVLSHPDG